MQGNPFATGLTGYKKVAQSSSSGTFAQKLAEIATVYASLTAEQKLTSYMAIGVAIYPLVTHTGVFVRASLSATVNYVEQLNITNNTYLFSQNGTISDISSSVNSSVFELWVWE